MKATFFLLLGIATLNITCQEDVDAPHEPESTQDPATVIKAEVSLSEPLDESSRLVWQTNDKELLEKLIIKPLGDAKIEENPPGWEIASQMRLTYDNGNQEVLTIFTGRDDDGVITWHHFSRGEKYYAATLGDLRSHLKESIKYVSDWLR